MKKVIFLAVVFLCGITAQLQAQKSPAIVGTWEMLSMTGTDEDGSPITRDVSTIKQYKVITPTHWMYVIKGMVRDTLRLMGNHGTYTLEGDKYVEKLSDASTTAFTMKVEGDKLYQDGAIFLPNGKKVVLHEVYKKVSGSSNPTTPLVGAWTLESGYFVADGKKVPNTTAKEFQLITPTHFMWVEKEGDQTKSVALGSYTLSGDKLLPKFIVTPPVAGLQDKLDITYKIEGNKLVLKGITTYAANGNSVEWGATYQRADAKPAKAVANKK